MMDEETQNEEMMDEEFIGGDKYNSKIVFIDRKKENEAVESFQKTGDLKVLEDVYVKRIPTLRSWAKKHYYPGLTYSVNDLFEELSVVFVNAAEKFDKSKGSFNTCLFTYLLNRLKNIKSSKHAKKRTSIGYDGPAIGMELSLDHEYSTSDGSQITLKEVIPSNESDDKNYIMSKTYLEETLNVLSGNNPDFREFLSLLGAGRTLVSIVKEYNTKKGSLRISKAQAKQLSQHNCCSQVSKLIQKKAQGIESDFKLINYDIKSHNKLCYEIELNRTEKTDHLIKSLKELRRNKEYYKEELGLEV